VQQEGEQLRSQSEQQSSFLKESLDYIDQSILNWRYSSISLVALNERLANLGDEHKSYDMTIWTERTQRRNLD